MTELVAVVAGVVGVVAARLLPDGWSLRAGRVVGIVFAPGLGALTATSWLNEVGGIAFALVVVPFVFCLAFVATIRLSS